MTIYEINKAIEDLFLVDEETGEVTFDQDALEDLQMEREQKVENLALYIKNRSAEAEAIRKEELALAARRKSAESAADRAKKVLEYALAGEKFSSPRVSVSYRKTKKLVLEDGFMAWAAEYAPHLLRVKDPEPDKKSITDYIKAGYEFPLASLAESVTMQIK